MDKQAVQLIQESANIPAILQQITDAKTQVPVAAAPESMKLLNLEKYMPQAARYRLKMATTSIDDFIRYNTKHDEEGATCFVDAEGMSAHTIIDLGTDEVPGHKENAATLQLHKTAAFKAITRIDGNRLSQKDASEFIEDWADNITSIFTKDGDGMTPAQAANALRNLSIEAAREINSQVGDFSESASIMERVEAKNQSLLPSEIRFSCIPYNGLKERTFKLRASILTGDEKPTLVFRVLQLEGTEEDIAAEFKDKLANASGGLELEVFIGTTTG